MQYERPEVLATYTEEELVEGVRVLRRKPDGANVAVVLLVYRVQARVVEGAVEDVDERIINVICR